MSHHATITMATCLPPPCIQGEQEACQDSVVLQNGRNYFAENGNYGLFLSASAAVVASPALTITWAESHKQSFEMAHSKSRLLDFRPRLSLSTVKARKRMVDVEKTQPQLIQTLLQWNNISDSMDTRLSGVLSDSSESLSLGPS
ncbi:hypothetical protein AOLI_G00096670 [Acnodon oligacanthus]